MEFKLHGNGMDKYGRTASRGHVHGYHNKPLPLDISKGAKHKDIANLKNAHKRNFIQCGGDYASKFTIGFEVEKNALHRGAVREYELFCGFENDGSAGFTQGVNGFEAVTHILPLVIRGVIRNAVFDMMFKANRIIEDQYSPSNARCGGHTNIGVVGMTGEELRVALRPYTGIVLALFRKRLKNEFCKHNLNMKGSAEGGYFNGWADKYQMCLVKDNIVEFRVVSRFESVKQMMRRYELFYELVDFAINVKGSYATFLKRTTPIVLSMYNGDTAKADEVLGLAKHFQKFINTGAVHQEIEQYVR